MQPTQFLPREEASKHYTALRCMHYRGQGVGMLLRKRLIFNLNCGYVSPKWDDDLNS